MKILSTILPLVLAPKSIFTAGLFADEAGQNDFTIATAGHGIIGTTYAQVTSDGKSVLTSSSSCYATAIVKDYEDNVGGGSGGGSNSGCYLSSRSLSDGSLNWRRNVCSQPIGGSGSGGGVSVIRHAVYSNPHDARVYTLDDYGMLRIWNDTNGALLKEMPLVVTTASVSVEGGYNPRIVNLDTRVMGAILTASAAESEGSSPMSEIVAFYNDAQFQDDAVLTAIDILTNARVASNNGSAKPSIFGVLPKPSSKSSYYVLAGWDRDGVTSLSEMGMTEVTLVDNEVEFSKEFIKLNPKGVSTSADIQVSSVHVETQDGKDVLIANVAGKDTELIYTPTTKNVEEVPSKTFVQCDDFVVYASGNDSVINIGEGDNFDMGDSINGFFGLQCYKDCLTVLVSTSRGTTSLLKIGKDNQVETLWENEEAFASASSAIFLDNVSSLQSAEGTDNDEDDEAALIDSLSFSSRLSSQMKSLQSFLSGGFIDSITSLVSGSGTGVSQKDAVFGLNKVAVIVSDHFSKVMAIDTSSSSKGRGNLMWSLNLNPSATWHKVVHGAANSRSSAFGQGIHHPHSPEILILSETSDSIEWRCVDGLRGRIISEASIPITSSVAQIIPVHGHSHASGGCKQNAAFILEDNSIAFVPSSAKGIIEASISSDVGMYTHTIDKDTGFFRSMKLSTDDSSSLSGKVEVVGETVFDPSMEKIINIAYPQRNEVVQSPATILGDDSLLLKYLNPHLCVVVTEATTEYMENFESNDQKTAFQKALESGSKISAKKPLGATKPGEATPSKVATTAPTLFINVIDTISGQVLHRVSHSHTSVGATPSSPTTVPVSISENWIVYAFPNAKSRRTEVGVLTLHEGMIDKHGITAFSSPEQLLTFSSMNSPKPIVLSKTYGVSYPVTAIGVTNTKGGISSKNFLFATGIDGKVVRIDRRLLDPRRPSGEPKKTEKKEGLMQ